MVDQREILKQKSPCYPYMLSEEKKLKKLKKKESSNLKQKINLLLNTLVSWSCQSYLGRKS